MKAAQTTLIASLALGTLALVAMPAQSAIETREQLQAQPRAWSAMAGVDTASVMSMAGTFASGADAGANDPFCDADNVVAQTLSHDFGESLVDDAKVGTADTQLWGSDVMGTWTLVMARGDQTSCIIASGVGYSDHANPDVFYASAGLTG